MSPIESQGHDIGVFRVNEANLHKLSERRHSEVLVHHEYLAHENTDEAVRNAFLDDIGAHHGNMRFHGGKRMIPWCAPVSSRNAF